MIAIKFTSANILEGRSFKYYQIFDGSTLRHMGCVKCDTNEPDLNINELRSRAGISDIYAIIDMQGSNDYRVFFNTHRKEIIKLDKRLAKDPNILKDTADYAKEQRATSIRQAAIKWEV